MSNNKATATIRSDMSSLRKNCFRTKSFLAASMLARSVQRTTTPTSAATSTTKCCQHRERPPDNADKKSCPNMTPFERPPPATNNAISSDEFDNLSRNVTAVAVNGKHENGNQASHSADKLTVKRKSQTPQRRILQSRASVKQSSSSSNQSTDNGKHPNEKCIQSYTPLVSLRQSGQEPKLKSNNAIQNRWCLLPQTVITMLCHILSQHQQTPSTSLVVATTTRTTTTTTTPTRAELPRCNRSRSMSSLKIQRTKFRLLPTLGATSFVTLLTLICLETVLLSTMSTCAKTFYMHWNTSNSIFRIDNTDHIIDVNKGNLAFEFDQVHIICPVYEPGTYENETEKYIIYNVSKVEYETCRITNADPRVIAICDKPQKLMFFTITFRPFTPQPGGLEFLPGNDYYFISTSSKDDLYRRIGGRCSTNNMKVVFKVCCAPEEKNKTAPPTTAISAGAGVGSGGAVGSESGGPGVDENNSAGNIDTSTNMNQGGHHHMNNINNIGMNGVNPALMPGGNVGGGVQLKPINGMGTSINSNIDQFNRIPIQPNVIGGNFVGGAAGVGGGGGIMLSPGHMLPPNRGGSVSIAQYPGHHHVQTGIRINNVPTQQQYYPPHKGSISNDDHHYNKHPNEVVKNEELTYNSAAASTVFKQHVISWNQLTKLMALFSSLTTTTTTTQSRTEVQQQQQQQQQQHYNMPKETTVDPTKHFLCYKFSELMVTLKEFIRNLLISIHPLILLPILAKVFFDCMCEYTLRKSASAPRKHHHRTKYSNVHTTSGTAPGSPTVSSQLVCGTQANRQSNSECR